MTIVRPALLIVFGLVVTIAAVVLAGIISYRLPSMGLALTSQNGAPVMIVGMDETVAPVALPAEMLAIRARGDRSAGVPVDGSVDAVRRSDRGLSRRGMAVQDRLAAIARQPQVEVLVREPSGRQRWIVRSVRPSGLRWPFWTDNVAAILAAAIALWIYALRPRAAESQAIALSGFGLALAAIPGGVCANGELIVGGGLWHALVMTNWAGAFLFGGGLVAFFALFPAPIGSARLRKIGLVAMAAASLALLVLSAAMLSGYQAMSVAVLALAGAILTLIAVQWWRSGSDPIGRAGLMLIGSATTVTIAVFLVLTYVPRIFGTELFWPDGAVFLLILPTYFAVGASVMRGQLLDLDRWAWRLAGSAAAILLLLGTDLALALAAGLSAAPALSVAVLLASAGWIILRQHLFDRWLRTGKRDGTALLARAGSVTLADGAERQFERWRESLSAYFEPLEMTAYDGHPDHAETRAGGLELLVPAPPFGPALMLRAAKRGRGLFRPEDCGVVDTFVVMCEQGETDRRAYDRGMQAERERIARDLHDDVSARLLTSLHREDAQLVRSDVRGALQEIRSLVSILQHETLTIAEMIGSARHDASERLHGAGVALDWPVDDGALTDRPIEIAVAKSIERAIREAITNVIRHSGARQVEVQCAVAQSDGGERLDITIADDGCGLDGARAGNGLRNIRTRMAELSGAAQIDTRPAEQGGGTLVRLSLPLADTPEMRG